MKIFSSNISKRFGLLALEMVLVICFVQNGFSVNLDRYRLDISIGDSAINRKDYALLFAFDDYQEYGDLEYSYSNALALSKALQEQYGFVPEIVRNPTQKEVRDKIWEYRQKIFGPYDQLLIHFSAQASYDDILGKGFLIPVDGKLNDPRHETWISFSEINESIDAIPCEHILLVLDSDYSGTFEGMINSRGHTPKNFKIYGNPKSIAFSSKEAKINSLEVQCRIYFASTGWGRTPMNSNFIPRIIQVLRTPPEAIQDSILTNRDIFVAIEELEPRPVMGNFGKSSIGGKFLFFVNSLPVDIREAQKQEEIPTLKGKVHLEKKEIYSKSGIFNVGEVYTLAVDLENVYETPIQNALVSLVLPEFVFPNSSKSIPIPKLDPKEHQIFQFSFFVSDLYQANQVAIRLDIQSAANRFIDFSEQLNFSLNPTECVIPSRKAKDRALFFAVDDYINYQDLSFPVSDAMAIAQELALTYNFEVEVIKNATRATIKEKMDEYIKKYANGTYDSTGQLLIYFSGHGELSDGVGYFLPSDAVENDLESSALAYPIWQKKFNLMSSQHILVVIDACYSGTFQDKTPMKSGEKESKVLTKPDGLPTENCPFLLNYQRFEATCTRKYLTSGGIEKTPDKSKFAEKFLFGLQTKNKGKRYVTIGELYEDTLRTANPLPLVGDFGKGYLGSNFLFFVRNH